MTTSSDLMCFSVKRLYRAGFFTVLAKQKLRVARFADDRFMIGALRPLQKERRLLENRRLDLDICKARLKKAKQAEAKAAVSKNFKFSLLLLSLLLLLCQNCV